MNAARSFHVVLVRTKLRLCQLPVRAKGDLETFELRELKDDHTKQGVDAGRFAFVPVKSTDTANLDTKKCIVYGSANSDAVKGIQNAGIVIYCCCLCDW